MGLFLCSVSGVIAQQSSSGSMSTQMMHAAPETLIDGTRHPELIPDATAYRLVFTVLGLAADATPDERTAQALRLRNAGLSDTDVNAAMVALDSFRSQYTDAIQIFNKSAHNAIASGGTPDLKSFDRRRDALVQATQDELKRVLSPGGMAAIDSLVQLEKKRMRVSASTQ